MSKHKNLKRNLLICLLAGSAVMYTLPLHAATSVIANNTLPMGEDSLTQNHTFDRGNLEMTITQNGSNGIIKWDSFNVGGSATVNFKGPQKGYNTLNYVNGANMSQIYGTINANNNGNIFIVNPAGVQIGNSAQINVGSLHVSNAKVTDEYLKTVNKDTKVNEFLQNAQMTNAALMSLGNINANKVTFEGNGRIVIDSERLKDVAGTEKLTADKIFVNTKDKNNVVIGYDAYENGSYANVNNQELVTLNGSEKLTKAYGYMWVEDVEQLQAINTNLSGNYALRNSIDATSTEQNGFTSIGSDDSKAFTGNFDGIDYNIFGLTIKNDGENTGLFGYTNNATISNVTLVGGSITGKDNVGAIVGSANNTTLTNVVNSAAVSGNSNVGGIVGSATNSAIKDAINTGTINGSGDNVGGLIGNLQNSKFIEATDTTKEVEKGLIGNSYNLGAVTGDGYNVGGLVGHAVNSTIGDGTHLVYNRLDVTGKYNVGGIVGNMQGTTVQNAENSGNVTASWYTTDKYIYYSAYQNVDDGTAEDIGNDRYKITVNVNAANVGGIAGTSSDSSTIENVANTGDVNSRTDTYEQYGTNHIYYTAGNVGGVVGRAEDTNITNATNRENEVRGAHNVGGVAGYFGGEGTVNGGINDGGDIMATGARFGNDFMTEHVRSSDTGDETFIIGNIGGVVGYMDGDNVYVTGSANRGTVHSQDIDDPQNVLYTSQAANTGGVVGRINRSDTKTLAEIQNEADKKEAAVNNSYNTGDVRGYAGVGGVVGMMYNGEVANSYNLGAINTTRRPQGGNKASVNMGGVVGDTTEESNAKAIIYNVYNKGQIGDETYNFYARHVGGVVGRLSGTVDKAYNTGAIYNGYSVVGGIAGWFYEGTISNSFNTGNITVLNKETAEKAGSQVGGIAGGMSAYGNNGTNFIYNAYNLGTLRSFNTGNLNNPNSVGGIVGKLVGGGGADTNVSIRNVYTTSNIYSGTDGENAIKDSGAGSIYGDDGGIGGYLNLAGANYIELGNSVFNNLEKTNANVKKINYNDRYNSTAYNFVELNTGDKIWADVDGANVSEEGYWRIYNNGDGTGTTPILNAFLPNAKDYFSGETDAENPMDGISSIQYGTAYDPLLTIIKANEDLTFDWGALGIQNDGGLAVYNAGLTLTDFKANGGTGYFGGIIYADESLNLKGTDDIGLGSASQIYGSDVTISTDGKVTIYGDITATGNQKDGNTTGSITINAGDVDVYGTLTSAKDGVPTKVSGIAQGAVADFDFGDIKDKDKAVTDIGNRFAVDVDSSVTGNIIINAGTKVVTGDDGKSETVTIGDGNVNLYYGNKQEGLITTGGDLTVTGTGDVYVDSDLDIGGDLTLTGNGANSEVVLDITNVGQVQADNGTVSNALEGFHNFMHHFGKQDGDGANINLKAEKSKDTKITVDMWDGKTFNLKKFDSNGHDFKNELDSMNVTINGNKLNGTEGNHVKDYTYIWVSDGEQLQGINNTGADGLDFNYALKGDINASDVQGYEAIGGTTGFTGTFDGRGNRVIGLTVNATDSTNNKTNAGIFSTVGEGGVVKNVNIYSGNFTGTDNAGAVAGMNSGRIENVTGFGNTVTVTGDTNNAGNAGGIVGVNNGTGTFNDNNDSASTLIGYGIYDVQSIGSVIAGNNKVVAGGLVGTNNGSLGNSYSDSAVTSTAGTTEGLGGVVGVNTVVGNVQYVDSLGVTNGGTNSNKVGGIIGVNNGNMYSGYNESIVTGNNNVGGIIGVNSEDVTNIVNATGVEGHDYVGGLIGDNAGNVTDGRNNGTITGNEYVGGMVGSNADGSQLKNLTNGESADITGENYVGGIAGTNAGTITAQNQANLINRGSITGQNYVGGVAGENIGTIEYVNNDVSLNVKDTTEKASYFGGVAGINGRVDDDPDDGVDNNKKGTITNATNEGNVIAPNADYVGGIVGHNTVNGVLDGMGNSNDGRVEGATYVGGVAGKNDAAITGAVNDMVGIENNGVVIAHKGGAGGIFGENTGDIKYAELTNNGIVSGTYSNNDVAGTGGIIGVNSGDIKHSSLKNNIGGQVIGTQNVGGLIGVNSGNIEGGRNEQEVDKDGKETVAADSYYKYQIYNNGTITANGNGSNIGGLFGTNSGKVEAAYNTGAINASGSTNVGGIAGVNEQGGELDQVFNTVMVADGATKPDGSKQETAITGGTNVGGLVGTNSGTLSNAYNTTEVKSTNSGVVGNAVGVNKKGAKVNFVYDVTNTDKKLIGTNNGNVTGSYSGNEADGNVKGITYVAEGDRLKENTYQGSLNDANTWKFYDGNSNPLLKVFLTNLTVNETVKIDGKEVTLKDYLNLVYNGKEQDLNIADLIEKGFITAPNEELLNAYKNTLKDQSNGLGESYLLDNADGQKNAGDYQNDEWLYSNQIHSSTTGSFNPNNLGYDINFVDNDGSITVDKATINIDLNDIYHTYGDVDNVYSDKDRHNKTSYEDSYTISNWTELDEVLQDYIEKHLNVQFKEGSDGAVNGDKTQSVGDYNWSLDFTLGGTDASNYQIGEGSGNVNSVTITGTDKSHVEKAKLTININNVDMTYGDKETVISGQYGYAASTNVGENLVNGDSIKDVIAGMTYENTAYNADGTTKDVIDGKYALQDKDVTGGSKYGNYEITINDGEVKMDKAQLVVDINDVTMTYGDKECTISNQYGYTVNNGLVNGDSLKDVIADMGYNNTAYNTDGTTKGVIDGKYALQDKDVTGGSKYGNYEITINDGKVTMGKAQLVVDINNVDMTYGDKESTISNQYGYTVNNGLVNGDSLKDVIADMGYNNTAYNADGTTKDVIDGKYALENKDITVGGKYGNYEVTINDGTVMMNKADLNIKVDNANTTVGKMPGELTGTVEGLTNGDTLPAHDFALEDDSLISVSGNHKDVIGIVIGGKFYELGDADWSNGLFANYDVNYEMGDLAVSVVEIPDNWPNNRWDYLFADNPFDRNENFRERKAEVNFVDGAMEI